MPCGVRPESQKPAAMDEQIPLLTDFADVKGNLNIKIILLTFLDPFLEMFLMYEEWSQTKRGQFSGGERKNVTTEHSGLNNSCSM